MIGRHRRTDQQRSGATAPQTVPVQPRQMHPTGAISPMLQKSHVVAALLAFFGGMFGIHKFYLGYYQTAFTMMAVSIVGGIATFGLAAAVVWVVAIVEGATYASRTQTQFEEAYVRDRRDWF